MKLALDAVTLKAKPDTESAKKKALRSVIEAIQDEDVEGAAKALELAIEACMADDQEGEEVE